MGIFHLVFWERECHLDSFGKKVVKYCSQILNFSRGLLSSNICFDTTIILNLVCNLEINIRMVVFSFQPSFKIISRGLRGCHILSFPQECKTYFLWTTFLSIQFQHLKNGLLAKKCHLLQFKEVMGLWLSLLPKVYFAGSWKQWNVGDSSVFHKSYELTERMWKENAWCSVYVICCVCFSTWHFIDDLRLLCLDSINMNIFFLLV